MESQSPSSYMAEDCADDDEQDQEDSHSHPSTSRRGVSGFNDRATGGGSKAGGGGGSIRTEATPAKAAAQLRRDQNRIAQREFRQRKQQHIRDLEAQVQILSGDHDERQELISLLVQNLLKENAQLRKMVKDLSGFIGEGLMTCLPRMGLTLDSMDAFVNRAETETAHEAMEALRQMKQQQDREALESTGASGSRGPRVGGGSGGGGVAPRRSVGGRGDTETMLDREEGRSVSPERMMGASDQRKRKSDGMDSSMAGEAKRSRMEDMGQQQQQQQSGDGNRPYSNVSNALDFNSWPESGDSNNNSNIRTADLPSRPATDPSTPSDMLFATGSTPLPALPPTTGPFPINGSLDVQYEMDPEAHRAAVRNSSTISDHPNPNNTTFPNGMNNRQYMMATPEDILGRSGGGPPPGSTDSPSALSMSGSGMETDGRLGITHVPAKSISTEKESVPFGSMAWFEAMRGTMMDSKMIDACQLLGYHLLNYKANPNYHLPPSLVPTEVQRTIPHEAIIDGIIFPSMRDKMIAMRGRYDILKCCEGLMNEWMIRGEDVLDERSWEISEQWFKEYPVLMDREAVAISNRWRIERGEEPMTRESLTGRTEAREFDLGFFEGEGFEGMQ